MIIQAYSNRATIKEYILHHLDDMSEKEIIEYINQITKIRPIIIEKFIKEVVDKEFKGNKILLKREEFYKGRLRGKILINDSNLWRK